MNKVYNTEPHLSLVTTLQEMIAIIRDRQKQSAIVEDVQIWSYEEQWFASVYFEEDGDDLPTYDEIRWESEGQFD